MKKLLSAALALALLFSAGTAVMAQAAQEIPEVPEATGTEEIADESPFEAGEERAFLSAEDLPEDFVIDGLNVVFVDEAELEALAHQEQDIDDLDIIPFVAEEGVGDFEGTADLDDASKVGEYQTESLTRSPVSATQSFALSMNATGSMQYATASLGANQILHATLACPTTASVNWDLYIVEMNPNTGVLGNTVASSRFLTQMNTYADGVRTMDEACSYINESGVTQYFAIIAQATTGGVDTTGTLTMSIDLAAYGDVLEPNDYPNNVYLLDPNATVSGANLNVSNDVDWFAIDNTAGDIGTIKIAADDSNVDIQVYTFVNNAMKLVGHNKASYNISTRNVYYVRVSNKNPTVPNASVIYYSISTEVVYGVVSDILVVLDGDMHAEFVDYGLGTYFRTKKQLNLRMAAITSTGLAVPNQYITLDFENPYWIEAQNEALGRAHFVANTGETGIVDVNWIIPTAYGMVAKTVGPVGNFTSVHYYDISYLSFICNGVKWATPFYHVARTDLW